jgi:alkylation response protein AidB-like acyl-CoA dehydrogenase
MQPSSFALAEGLDRYLGDPLDASSVFSFAHSLALDDHETFPDAACRALEDWGIQDYYVPTAHGGSLAHYEDVLQLMRMVARRDLTVAIGHGKTYLGAVCAWVGAEPDQANALGARVRNRAVVSLGLTERAHGSDLLASDFAALADPAGGFRLSGEKWLINNATRGELLCLLAVTGAERGPRSASLFLVDKHAVPRDTFRCLPKVRTHGIRGADISGVALRDTPVPATALIGEQGAGLDILLKSLQITRTMCASLSLGAGDTALRLVTNFVLERKLYGRVLIDLPQARRTLADALADLLIAEVVALSAARGIDTLPAEASVSSAVAKYLVPSSMDAAIAELGSLLGARGYLKDVYLGGLFQKVERDHRIVGLFDGNTLVNLQALIMQGRTLARGYAGTRVTAGDLEKTFALDRDPGTLDPRELRLATARGSSVLNAFADAADQLAALAHDNHHLRNAVRLTRRLLDISQQVHTSLAVRPARVDRIEPETFQAAKQYALCFAAASAVLTYLHNHDRAVSGPTAPLWADAAWLRATLGRLLCRLQGHDEADAAEVDLLVEPLIAQTRARSLYSLCHLPLMDGAPC